MDSFITNIEVRVWDVNNIINKTIKVNNYYKPNSVSKIQKNMNMVESQR